MSRGAKIRACAAGSLLIAVIIIVSLATSFGSYSANAKTDYDFSGIYLNRESVSIKEGGSFSLSLRKINAPTQDAVWSSDNTAIATVEDGEIFAKACGKTTVHVKVGDFQDSVTVIVTEEDPVYEEYDHTMELMQDFLDLRFGMFLHFNSATYEFAQKGGDWGGESYTSTFNPATWNPTGLDCLSWAQAAKDAGMTFAVLTTKHHDGFDLWDSKYTDYDVGSATLKTDVVKEYTDACREVGIEPGLYFSMLDLKHNITSGNCTPTDVEFIKAQLTELLTGYGDIPFIIFDGWNAWWGGPNYSLLPYDEIVNLIHSLQPDCLVINISCEANNNRSQVAMFESAAGQQVPEWFNNVNISCNTPTSHWFWCYKYANEEFKSADWVISENLNKFRDSDTVFILNVSPNQQGQLMDKYFTLLDEIGELYSKMPDVDKLPDDYAADYDYRNNLLFHKKPEQPFTDGNATADRATDGYTDYEFSHETASKSSGGRPVRWSVDIGYKEKLGRLTIHFSQDQSASDIEKLYVYITDEYVRTPTYASLSKNENAKEFKVTDFEVDGNCYSIDLGGIEGRNVSIVSSEVGILSMSEIILNPADVEDDEPFALWEKFDTHTHYLGSTLSLPESAVFVTADGRLVEDDIVWNSATAQLDKAGRVIISGRSSKGGASFDIEVIVTNPGRYEQVSPTGVTASSMWSQAESLGWAHPNNLINGSGLTVNSSNFFFSTHDNPYNGTSMWHSHEGNTTAYLIYSFPEDTTVTNALIWNHNQKDEADRGVKNMTVYYTDKENPSASDWIKVDDYTLKQASAQPDQPATDFISFGSINVRKIKLDLTQNYGDDSVIGLSKVIFFNNTEDSTASRIELAALVTRFEMLSKYDYPASDYDTVKAAYNAAVALLDDDSQTDVSQTVSSFSAALESLMDKYDPKTIENTDELAIKIDENNKTLPDSIEIQFSDGSREKVNVSWENVPADYISKSGTFTLNGTITGTPVSVSATVTVCILSKDALSAVIEEYKNLELDGYTKDSVEAFEAALAQAKITLDTATSQEAINTAKAALKHAKYSLEKIYPDVEAPEEPDDTTSDNPDTTEPEDTAPGNPDTTEPEDTTHGTPDTTEPEDTTSGSPDTTEPEDTTHGTPDTKDPDKTDGKGMSTAAVVVIIVVAVAVVGGGVAVLIVIKLKKH